MSFAGHPKIIGIRFFDNDFSTVCRVFLSVLGDMGLGDYGKYKEDLKKETIVDLFNESAFGLYCLAQNRGRYASSKDKEHLKEYLKISEENVYFDDEVTRFLKNTNPENWDNGEFHVLDTTQTHETRDNPYIYSV